jgi:hypothetical protein
MVAPRLSISRIRSTCRSGSDEISSDCLSVSSSTLDAANSWIASGVWMSST